MVSNYVIVAVFQIPVSDSMTGWGWAPEDFSRLLLTEKVWGGKQVLSIADGRAGAEP